MATPTTIDTDTELSAVNSILGAIGQAPVTTLGTVDEVTGELTFTGALNIAGTYARSSGSTVLTITDAAHGLLAGHTIYIDFTSGTSSTTSEDGSYVIQTVPSADTFTITTTATTASSGNCEYDKRSFSLAGLSWALLKEVKATLDGVPETNFVVSGSTLTFDTAPAQGAVVRIYTEKEIYNTLANPEISFIYSLLTEVNKDIQNESWIFNLEKHVKKSPEAGTGYITIPNNVLRYDMHDNFIDKTRDLVTRNGRLYDTVDHTDVFTEDIYLDIVYLWKLEDLPNVFKRYITYRAAVRAATQLVSNPSLVQLLGQQEGFARASCIEYECQQGDHSFLGHSHDTYYKSYKPYTALRR